MLYLSNETSLEKSTRQNAGVHRLDLVGAQISRFNSEGEAPTVVTNKHPDTHTQTYIRQGLTTLYMYHSKQTLLN